MDNEQKLVTYIEEAKECLAEALYLLHRLKDLVKEAKPIVESELEMASNISRMNVLPRQVQEKFDSTETRSEKWIAKFKELFPNET